MYDIILTRRPPPPPPQTFICCGCKRDIALPSYRFDPIEAPPLCRHCQRHWSKSFGGNVQGCTRGERRHMERLIAVITMIQWEARNAPRTR